MTVTRDAFLGGRVHLYQPLRGYRAGVDPVLLAASVSARAGETVLDLGCGAGAISLCLQARIPGLRLTGFEAQPAYAALARRAAQEAGVAFDVIEGDVSAPPAALRHLSFNHVVTNPPYFLENSSTVSPDPGRAQANAETVPLADWIDLAARRLHPGGWLWMVQRADRLLDVAVALEGRFGSVSVRPVVPRSGRDASLVLVRARKGGRAAMRLMSPLVLHSGDVHRDGGDYTPQVAALLRDAAPLTWDA